MPPLGLEGMVTVSAVAAKGEMSGGVRDMQGRGGVRQSVYSLVTEGRTLWTEIVIVCILIATLCSDDVQAPDDCNTGLRQNMLRR